MIMQIEVGTSSPHVPGSIHERTHHWSSQGGPSIEWAQGKAKCPSPGEREMIFCDLQSGNQLWFGQGQLYRLSCKRYSSGDNGIFHTEQIGHVVQGTGCAISIAQRNTRSCLCFCLRQATTTHQRLCCCLAKNLTKPPSKSTMLPQMPLQTLKRYR